MQPTVNQTRHLQALMDLGIIVAIVMLVIWAFGALVADGPGWIHLLLTVGVSMLIWRIVVRTDRVHPKPRQPEQE